MSKKEIKSKNELYIHIRKMPKKGYVIRASIGWFNLYKQVYAVTTIEEAINEAVNLLGLYLA